MKPTKVIHNFKALELKLTEKSLPHVIYFKEHTVREHTPDKPSGRTLLVINIPPFVDETGIANAFKKAGVVKSVHFSQKPSATEKKSAPYKFLADTCIPTYKVAYLVFEKVAHIDKALKLSELIPLNSNGHEILFGMKKWIEEYNSSILMPKVLKERVEAFMKKHDEETKKLEKQEKQLEEEDEDGWITVTKRGKVQSFARSDKVENKIMAKEEKKKERKELKNFYTFQIRESKMKHIVALRQKFEEDKKKIAYIKQSRRFKPF
ncbi:hypothetical protein ACJJTC_017592 [Scirpophaga incertulas]